MTEILMLINNYIDHIIVIAGVAVAAFLIVWAVFLSKFRQEAEERLAGHRGKTVVNRVTLETKQELYVQVPREEADSLRARFTSMCSVYMVFVQLIPVFPLMGILGTVAGLILNVQAQDLEAVFASLNTALSSTLIALIFAIILKFIDAVSTSRIIYKTETIFDDYDRRFRDAIDMGRFDE